MPRRRSAVESRVALGEAEVGAGRVRSLKELAAQLEPYVDGALQTLGQQAMNGDADAAKKILDFLSIVAREETSSHGLGVLDAIARIRAGS